MTSSRRRGRPSMPPASPLDKSPRRVYYWLTIRQTKQTACGIYHRNFPGDAVAPIHTSPSWQAMNGPARAAHEKITRDKKAQLCRNTLCISKSCNEFITGIFREMPKAGAFIVCHNNRGAGYLRLRGWQWSLKTLEPDTGNAGVGKMTVSVVYLYAPGIFFFLRKTEVKEKEQ